MQISKLSAFDAYRLRHTHHKQPSCSVLTLQNTDKDANLPLSSNVQTLTWSPDQGLCPKTPVIGSRSTLAINVCTCAVQNFPYRISPVQNCSVHYRLWLCFWRTSLIKFLQFLNLAIFTVTVFSISKQRASLPPPLSVLNSTTVILYHNLPNCQLGSNRFKQSCC